MQLISVPATGIDTPTPTVVRARSGHVAVVPGRALVRWDREETLHAHEYWTRKTVEAVLTVIAEVEFELLHLVGCA